MEKLIYYILPIRKDDLNNLQQFQYISASINSFTAKEDKPFSVQTPHLFEILEYSNSLAENETKQDSISILYSKIFII